MQGTEQFVKFSLMFRGRNILVLEDDTLCWADQVEIIHGNI